MLKFDIVNFVCVVVNLLVLYVLMKKFCNKTYAIKSNLDKPPIFDMANYKPVK